MSRTLPIYVVTILALSVAVVMPEAHAQQPPRREHKHIEREQIEALEKQWQTAIVAGDAASMDKLLSDDFLGIEANGEVVTKAQQLAHMRSRQFVIDKLQTSDVKIKLVGQIVAIVTSLAQVTGIIDGDHLQGAYRYTRVYHRPPGGIWRVTSFEVTPATRLHPTPPPK